MAEKLDIEQLKNILECAICYDMFDNPKRLNCNHHFCKECLEKIIQFKDDGVGRIHCPLQCDVLTVIAVDKSVNDLPLSYEFKAMLELLKTKDDRPDPENFKCEKVNCSNTVSVCCCKQLMCSSCSIKHAKSDGDHVHQHICCDKRRGKLMVICKQHQSLCTHLCEDGKLLCLYCMNRKNDHTAHLKATIEQDVELLKQVLIKDANEKEQIQQYQRTTEENVKAIKKKFDDLLDSREEECLSYFKDFLKEEKKILKNKLNSVCSSHMEQYLHDVPDNYCEETMQLKDTVLAIEKRSVLDIVDSNRVFLPLTCDVFSLDEDFNFLSEHPLGDLHITPGEKVSIWGPLIPTLRDNFKLNYKKENIQHVFVSNDNKTKMLQPVCAGRSSISKRKCEEGEGGEDACTKHANKLRKQLQKIPAADSSSQDIISKYSVVPRSDTSGVRSVSMMNHSSSQDIISKYSNAARSGASGLRSLSMTNLYASQDIINKYSVAARSGASGLRSVSQDIIKKYSIGVASASASGVRNVTMMNPGNKNVEKYSVGKCANCQMEALSIWRCTKCKNVWYCSLLCQMKHWPNHKSFCNSLAGGAK